MTPIEIIDEVLTDYFGNLTSGVEAGAVLEALAEHGYGVVGTDDRAHTRTGDPETSHEAAEALTEKTLKANQRAVLGVLRTFDQPCVRPQLIERYGEMWEALGFPKQSDSGIRSRLADLIRAGIVSAGEKVSYQGSNHQLVSATTTPRP